MNHLGHNDSIYEDSETGEKIVTELESLKSGHLRAAEHMLEKLQLALEQHPTKRTQLLNARNALVRFHNAVTAL